MIIMTTMEDIMAWQASSTMNNETVDLREFC